MSKYTLRKVRGKDEYVVKRDGVELKRFNDRLTGVQFLEKEVNIDKNVNTKPEKDEYVNDKEIKKYVRPLNKKKN
jgi:DNA gyrase/topoisomerase IV subunit B